MLNNVRMKKVASYDDEQVLLDLARINFIYGDNGSGKSTIAKFIAGDQEKDYSRCSLEWDAYGSADVLVYSREFVDNTLRNTDVPGVFTFGDGTGPAHDKLKEKLSIRERLSREIAALTNGLQKKRESFQKENEIFKDDCWKFYGKYKTEYSVALKGFNVKEKFKEKCVEYVAIVPKLEAEKLKINARAFFSDQPEKLPHLPVVSVGNLKLYESASIFQSRIVGKENIPISRLINMLGNSDWVKRGMGYYDGDKCPFCQQATPSSLKDDLERCFDEAYDQQIDELKGAIEFYRAEGLVIIETLNSLESKESDLFSFSSIETLIKALKLKFEKNLAMLAMKTSEPSRSVELDSLSNDLEQILKIIAEAQKGIASFNLRIDDFDKERKALISEVWAHIGQECKDSVDAYKKRITPIKKAIQAMENKVAKTQSDKGRIENDINEIERQIVSIGPAKEVINDILNTFSFDSFQIVDSSQKGYYQIKRGDGSIAKDSLSEGERTFITFLYFYQLIRGSVSQEKVSSPKIVVFDDPVSSLDSKILFVVSTLIRSLYCSTILDELNIKQIIILTHNLYFHKEITFLKSLKSLTKTPLKESAFKYWVIRKKDGVSTVTHYEKNPIKTNYQLLWDEVKRCEDGSQVGPTICNTLRRILENYFGILGGISIASLPDYFQGEEKLVCRSMTSWVHDGSHCIFDGIDVGTGQEYAESYLPVFKKIFENTQQIEHYNMMMKG